MNDKCDCYPENGDRIVCKYCQEKDEDDVSLNKLLSAEELNRVRQWFDFIQDTGTDFLVEGDFELAKKIYEKLSMRVPNSINAAT